MAGNIRIGALISGGGTNLQAIINECIAKKIDGSVVFVGTDNPHAKGLERAKNHGIPTFIVPYADMVRSYDESPDQFPIPEDFMFDEVLSRQTIFPENTPMEVLRKFFLTRAAAEAELLEKMTDFDLLVLAGFMRKLTPYFIDRVNIDPEKPRIMNIHPALLPAFPGTDGYGDTFRYGCKIGGCTVHFIDYGEDTGPIIGQRAFEITADDTIESVRKKGLRLEWELYPECVRKFAKGNLSVKRTTYQSLNGETRFRNIVCPHF